MGGPRLRNTVHFENLSKRRFISKPNILVDGAGIAVNPTTHAIYVADVGSDQIDILTLGPAPETR